MAKDILLFGPIWQYNAMYFFDQIKEATKEKENEELVMRINSEGGSPDYSMSMIEKVNEMQDQFSIKVGAQAHSSALFFLCYVDTSKVECIDTTQSILHRAAFPSWLEKSESFAGSMYEQIRDRSNKDLEKAFRAKVDVSVLESLPQFKDKNLTLKDIFATDGGARVEVLLTGSDLKKIGLVSKVNKITPTKQAELESQYEKFKSCQTLQEYKLAAQAVIESDKKVETKPVHKMTTAEELKSQHPALYASIVAEAEKSGSKKEKNRVEAWLAYQAIDAEAVKKGIEDGSEVDMKVMAQMQVKALSSKEVVALKDGSAGAVETKEVKVEVKADGKTAKTAEEVAKEKVMADFETEVNTVIGLEVKN